HVRFIDDVDLVPALHGHEFDLFPQVADLVDAAVARRVDFDDVQRHPVGDRPAGHAGVVRGRRRPALAVEGLREDARCGRLAGAAGGGTMGWYVLFAFAVVATALVYRDAVARLPRTAARVWTAVTFVTAGLAAPAYLIARPSRGSTWGFSEVVAVPLFFVLAILPIAILLESWAVRQGLLSPFGS